MTRMDNQNADSFFTGTMGLPPSEQNYEQVVVGAVLERPEMFYELSSIVGSGDFFSPNYREIFATFERLEKSGAFADFLAKRKPDEKGEDLFLPDDFAHLVGTDLLATSRLGLFPDVRTFCEWTRKLGIWAGEVPVRAYAVRVELLSRIRQLGYLCAETADEIRRGTPREPDSFVDERAAKIVALATRPSEVKTRATLSAGLASAYTELRDDAADREAGIVRTVPTGYADVDELTQGGMRDGQLWILAARPGAGKTALALNIAVNAAATGAGVVFYSIEMAHRELTSRVLASESGVSLPKILRAQLTPEDWAAMTPAASFLSSLPMVVDDQGGIPLGHLAGRLRRDAASWPAKHSGGRMRLVVVDYLQLVTTPHLPKNTVREQQVASVARGLKALAKELNVCVLALAQMNRETDKREGGVPRMSDLRESGQIEAEADLIAFLTPGAPAPVRRIDVHVVKQRSGSAGRVTLTFDAPHMRFHNVDKLS